MNANDLLQQGFTGGIPFSALRTGRSQLPEAAGVYAVVRRAAEPPTFLHRSTGRDGRRGDPTVDQPRLAENWVDGVEVVYVGMASLRASGKGLRNRVGELLHFGAGKADKHWGGRFLWQLADAEQMDVYWKLDAEPRTAEREILAHFGARNDGRRPFANLVD